jgi:hypothetical protein
VATGPPNRIAPSSPDEAKPRRDTSQTKTTRQSLQIRNQSEELAMPLQDFRYQFARDFQLFSFRTDFPTARVFLSKAKPAEGRPSLKRMLNKFRAASLRN